jgi:hypothetical protein
MSGGADDGVDPRRGPATDEYRKTVMVIHGLLQTGGDKTCVVCNRLQTLARLGRAGEFLIFDC